ncbi:MAG: tyrosine recombinase XerC [Chloroflexi bacterium]|nr:tyrosine recombinase XerC [Chloroflexota bacterium]
MSEPRAIEPPPPDPRALEALERYLGELALVRQRSERTIRNYRDDLTGFFAHLAGAGVAFDEAGREQARTYLGLLLQGEQRAPASVKRIASTIRAFYGWLDRAGELRPGRPGDSILRLRSPKAPNRLPQILSGEETGELMAAPEDDTPGGLRDRALLELLYGAGLRVSEAAALDSSDLDLTNRQVRVLGKGKRQRIALFGRPARDALRRYLEDGRPQLARGAEAALFLNRSGGRLSARSIQSIVRAAGTAAAVRQRVHPHLLRHSFATHMLDEGADLRIVQQLLGHASADTTQIYTAVTGSRKQAIVSQALARARDIERDGDRETNEAAAG